MLACLRLERFEERCSKAGGWIGWSVTVTIGKIRLYWRSHIILKISTIETVFGTERILCRRRRHHLQTLQSGIKMDIY